VGNPPPPPPPARSSLGPQTRTEHFEKLLDEFVAGFRLEGLLKFWQTDLAVLAAVGVSKALHIKGEVFFLQLQQLAELSLRKTYSF
jgi:hypothetical protein